MSGMATKTMTETDWPSMCGQFVETLLSHEARLKRILSEEEQLLQDVHTFGGTAVFTSPEEFTNFLMEHPEFATSIRKRCWQARKSANRMSTILTEMLSFLPTE